MKILLSVPAASIAETKTFGDEYDSVLIGRSRVCDVSCIAQDVSRTHLRITKANGEFLVRDNNSLNGTFVVNGDAALPIVPDEDVLLTAPFKLRLGTHTFIEVTA